MELGNSVVNRIYESRIGENCELKPATENCEISVREAWIKAKYVEKRFVCGMPKPTDYLSSETAEVLSIDSGEMGKRATLSLGAPRKWAVKKFRRRRHRERKRQRSSSKSSDDPVIDDDDDDDDESINIPSMSLSISREDLLIVGDDLGLETYETPGILGSDQESTEGENEPEVIHEVPFSKLNANLMLYQASAVHNLPVMCMAFALGADKNWRNIEDHNRTYLHQAVLSV